MWSSPLEHWALDPAVRHLNHGAWGACPRAVLDAAEATRRRVEASPMRFYVLDWQRELDAARARAAAFVGAPAERFAFVPNATTGVAIAVASAELADGDEILATDHAYRACKNQLARAAARTGARIAIAELPLPFDPDAAADAIARATTARTRLVLLDHVTSPTAVVLPLDRILPPLAARGVQIIVDGAHGPGQLALDVGRLLEHGVGWYAGNHHKWMCAPKSTGFLVASAAMAARTLPLVTSHGASPEFGPPNRFHALFDWAGTRDLAQHLAVPIAIDEVARLGGGDWAQIRARNHALALAMRQVFLDAGATRLAPDDAIGSMATIPIELPANTTALALQEQLLRAGWETPIVPWPPPGGPLVRVCAHLYNDVAQAEALLAELRARGVRLR